MSLNLNDLNPEQRAAVTATEGPLLVLAGAGSGKTRVITARIAYLIRGRKIPPEAILAVTFTNKAAREMAERVGALLRGPKARPLICTFHSFGVRLLRAHIGLLGYRPNFAIYDDHDQLSLLRGLMEEGDYDTELYPPKTVHYALQQAKSRGMAPQAVAAPGAPPDQLMLGRLMEEYQQTLRRMNAIDFEDILQLSLRLCREHPEQAGGFFRRFRYVMVDEYQDTNRSQYELLRSLAAGHGNLCVVGDDDQSIYGWRGAEPGNILGFERDFAGAAVIRLERNYRSSDTILEAANQVIRNNAGRREKRLHGNRGPGEPLAWLLGEDESDELDQVVTHLRRTHRQGGGALSDFAVLYRSNHQSRAIEERLREEGIPYLLVGGTRFYDRKEIKDALAYLRLIHTGSDEVNLQRILNFPRRGIGNASRVKLAELAARGGRPMFELLREASTLGTFAPEAARSMEHFAALILRYRERFRREPLGAVFRDLLAELGFHRAVEKERREAASGERASALVAELELAADRFAGKREGAGLKEYLEHVTLFTLPGEDEEAGRSAMVSLMTVHAAKGLEFAFVYLIGMAEEVFPNQRALADGGEEEERRLFYVALTRAKRQAVFSMARRRRRYGEVIAQQPSRFLLEIEPRLFQGDAPSLAAPPPEVKAQKAARAKERFFDQMRKLRAAEAGD
jgi:superfamily I DNA/RNA helicase